MSVDGVKSWMRFWGWDEGGGKFGSVKRDVWGGVIARHGDAQWEKDLEAAINADRRDREGNIREMSKAESL